MKVIQKFTVKATMNSVTSHVLKKQREHWKHVLWNIDCTNCSMSEVSQHNKPGHMVQMGNIKKLERNTLFLTGVQVGGGGGGEESHPQQDGHLYNQSGANLLHVGDT